MKFLKWTFIGVFLVFSCSKSSNGDGIPDGAEPIGVDGTEGGVALYFPQENMLCNLGTDITPTESTVYFEWKANGSDSYLVVVENLLTGVVIQRSTSSDILAITLQRATPYKWFVESAKGSKKDQSPTWQFYNAGPGVQSYAPFPATIDSPTMAQNMPSANTVTLQWTGNDVDDDIVGYDIYFGTSTTPVLHSSNVTASSLSVSVSSNTVYFWKVITRDSLGNSSESDIYQFRMQ